ncbi:YbaK/EbsC family protein [uncultured Trichococcus sp.]|uniref:prolyl-tRNA synthetase associated domain-containing protein n=1 Tax=uncultured Trichococcus sp. TaxID=189665 RepID=UPI0029C60364|nr:YbaK/EbsC family protein [uncultured Trichococcus sp.]
MFYVSAIQKTSPSHFGTPLQQKVYSALEALKIPFERVNTDEAITMEDCTTIEAKLAMRMVKTLFLCNRQKTAFYLFITVGDKPFHSKKFSAALDVARVSFAPSELMQTMLGTNIGAATVFSSLLDTENNVQIVFDRDVLLNEWYGCSDGTTTGYMKVRTEDIYGKFLPFTNHIPVTVEVQYGDL